MADVCSVCGRLSDLRCPSPCGLRFCGRECQRKNWKEHKKLCPAHAAKKKLPAERCQNSTAATGSSQTSTAAVTLLPPSERRRNFNVSSVSSADAESVNAELRAYVEERDRAPLTVEERSGNAMPLIKLFGCPDSFVGQHGIAEPINGEHDCPVCLDTPAVDPMQLPCQHTICRSCLNLLHKHTPFGSTCPMCRADGPVSTELIVFEYCQLVAQAQRQVGQAQHELYAKAKMLLERALESYPDDSTLLLFLATMHSRGEGCPVNHERAFELYQTAAQLGNVSAQYNLGRCYDQAVGTEADATLAIEWFTVAADNGSSHAQYAMGLKYETGRGVPVHLQRAVEYMEASAGQGHSWAQNNLGCMYGTGTGVPLDQLRSFELLKQSANQGQPDGCYNVAACYLKGMGVEQDVPTAIKLYQLSAELGFPKAQHNLALYYLSGQHGLPCDPERASILEKQAAAQGLPQALVTVGAYHLSGEHGCEKDPAYALQLWEAAAEGSGGERCVYDDAGQVLAVWSEPPSPDAQYNLGLVHAGLVDSAIGEIRGFKRSKARALELWKAAATSGHAEAQQILKNLVR